MLMGAELLAFSGAQIHAVQHEGNGRIRVLVSSRTTTYERLGDPNRKPGAVPNVTLLGSEVGGVSFWISALTAGEFLISIRSRIAGDFPAFDAKPVETVDGFPWRDIGQIAGFELAHMGSADTQHLFARALNTAYAVRLDFDRSSAARFVVLMQAALSEMSQDDKEATVECMNVSIEVGKKREEGTVAVIPPRQAQALPAPRVAPALSGGDSPQAGGLFARLKQLAHKVIDRI